jgi:hypothetical protein
MALFVGDFDSPLRSPGASRIRHLPARQPVGFRAVLLLVRSPSLREHLISFRPPSKLLKLSGVLSWSEVGIHSKFCSPLRERTVVEQAPSFSLFLFGFNRSDFRRLCAFSC